MKKVITILTVFLLLGISTMAQGETVTRVPYTLSGTVRDENGKTVEDAEITITNLETGETNLKTDSGVYKTTDSFPVRETIKSNSDGNYLFELSNLNRFNNGDRLRIDAKKGDKSGTKTLTLNTDNSPNHNANIVISPSNLLGMCLILIILLIILSIVFVYKRIS